MSKMLGNLMKQAQKMQEQVAQLQKELANRTVEATAGGGMVKVVANGNQQVISVKIDPTVVDPAEIEMLEDLVVAAVNEALRKAQEMTAAEVSRLTGGMKIPGLFGA
ncbi:MAG TPA: YbaB/EbfC family nucleoid-associated protein [bacterium]|nr:YbaB/EbfC family nucleoid-associated protein [bacterium]